MKHKIDIDKITKVLKISNIKINTSILLILAALIGLGYSDFSTFKKLENTNNDLKNSKEDLQQKISDIETILLAAQEENLTMSEALEAAREKSESLERQFDRVNDNVEELEKITTTDPELLQKYSKIFFLNEHYAPADLATISSKWTYDKSRKYEIHDDVWPYLEDLLKEAEDDDLDLKVISAFRSFYDQATLKGNYTVVYGAGTANQFSADQGYSEHQLGTTVDFTNSTVGATFSGFASSPEYKWLQDNAYKYGFTLSYPENNQSYEFEPWHWRFVGKKLAKRLHNDNEFFYDLSQRKIDEYVADLFD